MKHSSGHQQFNHRTACRGLLSICILHFAFCILHSLPFPAGGFAAEPPRSKILLLGQKPDTHPPTTHEYMAGMRILSALLAKAPGVETTIVQADDPWSEGPEQIAQADVVVLFLTEGAKWVSAEPRRYEAFTRHASKGKGLAALHWGMGTREAAPIEPFLRLFGGCHGGPDRRFQVVKECEVTVDPKHPICLGVENFRIAEEEFYYKLKLVASDSLSHPIGAAIDGENQPVSWAWERPDGGRSFGFSGGHFHANWREGAYRRLIAQAVLWCGKLPIPADGMNVELPEEAYSLENDLK